MSALSAARLQLANKGKILLTFGRKAAASQTFYNGAAACVNTSGKLIPAAEAAGLRSAGVVDLANKTSVVTALDDVIAVKCGIFPFFMGTSTDTPTEADVLRDVYFMDDQTVSRLPFNGATPRPIAGQLQKIEAQGGTSFAWVAMGFKLEAPSNANGGGTAYQGPGSVESVAAAGALSVNTQHTILTVDATKAYTLANGLFIGQRKSVSCDTGTNTPVGTITPATPSGFATVTALGARGDTVEFLWTAAGWVLVNSFGCTFT